MRIVALLGGMAATLWATSYGYVLWQPISEDADALYQFQRKGKVGYIDREGRVVIPPHLPYGSEFRDGLMPMPEREH